MYMLEAKNTAEAELSEPRVDTWPRDRIGSLRLGSSAIDLCIRIQLVLVLHIKYRKYGTYINCYTRVRCLPCPGNLY